MTLVIKRIYEPPLPDDGYRVLVDRLWPRGVSKDAARLDLWLKDVAPSPELRKEWHHAPDRFDEFAALYRAELDTNPAVDQLREIIATQGKVTLLFGARDVAVNHAKVLQDYVLSQPQSV